MRYDLRQLGRRGGAAYQAHVDRTFEPDQFEPSVVKDEEYEVVAPVHLVMDVRRDRDAYGVTGTVQTRLRLACARCLEPFEAPVDSRFDLRFVPASPGTEEGEGVGEREVAEDELTTAYYRDEQIDLGELMHEQFVLALPMKALCSQRCQGLCPECGANLNRTACDCAPAWRDPRLAALEGLLPKQKEN